MRPTWRSYDAIAHIYEYDMGRNMRFDDVGYYVRHAGRLEGEVLDLGCGTGRISLALLRAGLSVSAVDASAPMLERLRHNCQKMPPSFARRLTIIQMDLCRWGLRGKFAAILCPYSLFTYFVEPDEYSPILHNIRGCLLNGGQFICDVFIPNRKIPFGETINDYQRELPDGSVLTRSKVIVPDGVPSVHRIDRHYERRRGQDILEQFSTTERIRCWQTEALEAVLKQHSFEIVAREFDYGASTSEASAQFVTFRCRPGRYP